MSFLTPYAAALRELVALEKEAAKEKDREAGKRKEREVKLRELLRMRHSPSDFVAVLEEAKDDATGKKALRRYAQHDTVRSFVDLRYSLSAADGKQCVTLKKEAVEVAPLNTYHYPKPPAIPPFSRTFSSTSYDVVPLDCLEVMARIRRAASSPHQAVLISPASSHAPGGSYRFGGEGLEEELHRRTNLFSCLHDPQKKYTDKRTWSYPLEAGAALFSKGVQVIRDGEEEGYRFLPEPFAVDIISAPYAEGTLADSIRRGLELALHNRMRTVFSICARHNCKWVVLPVGSAPLARRIKAVLEEEKFRRMFYRVTFVPAEGLAEKVAAAVGTQPDLQLVFPQSAQQPQVSQQSCKKRAREDASGQAGAVHSKPSVDSVLGRGLTVTGEDFRARLNIRKKILEALGGANDLSAPEKAAEVEAALFTQLGCSCAAEAYRMQLKTLLFNLRDPRNAGLRQRIVSGVFPAAHLPAASAADLRNPEKQAEATGILQEIKADMSAANAPERETSLYTCGRCKRNRCSFTELQTRSGDEPMTQFITCLNCGKRWKM